MPALETIGMATHSFTVEVSGIDVSHDGYEDALYEAGCGDALVVVVGNQLALDFDRQASSFGLAVETAINDISRAGGTVTGIKKIEK